MNPEKILRFRKELALEDFEAWQWAVLTCPSEKCRCHQEVTYRESQGEGQWVDDLEAQSKKDGLELPTLYVAWNPRCPIHGFLPNSAEYRMDANSTETAAMEPKWYQRWRELMKEDTRNVGLTDVSRGQSRVSSTTTC